MECLIKKLKAEVTDNTLPKFNVLGINVEKRTDLISTPVADNVSFTINVVRPTTIVASGGWFSVTNFAAVDTDKLTEYEIPADTNTTIWCKWDDFYLEVLDASAIKTFITGNYTNLDNPNHTKPTCIAPILSAKMPYLENLICIYSNVTGNISALSNSVNYSGTLCLSPNKSRSYYNNKTNLTGYVSAIASLDGITRLMLNGVSLYNSDEAKGYYGASELGKLTNLTQMYLRSSGTTGRLEKFVEFAVDNGKTTNTEGILAYRFFINFKFFGISPNYSNMTYNKIFWEGKNKIWAFAGGAYNNFTEVYAYGCTSGEIAAWEAQGMRVEIITDSQ